MCAHEIGLHIQHVHQHQASSDQKHRDSSQCGTRSHKPASSRICPSSSICHFVTSSPLLRLQDKLLHLTSHFVFFFQCNPTISFRPFTVSPRLFFFSSTWRPPDGANRINEAPRLRRASWQATGDYFAEYHAVLTREYWAYQHCSCSYCFPITAGSRFLGRFSLAPESLATGESSQKGPSQAPRPNTLRYRFQPSLEGFANHYLRTPSPIPPRLSNSGSPGGNSHGH